MPIVWLLYELGVLLLLRLLVRRLLLLLFPGTMGLSSLHCHGGVLGFCKLSLFRYQWSKEGQVSMCVDAGLFAYVLTFLDLVLDLVFSLYQNPSCSIQTRKRACFAFLFVGVAHVGNRRSDGIRSKNEYNGTMIVWSRLLKLAFPMGKEVLHLCRDRGTFWLGIAKRKHCKDLGVWV